MARYILINRLAPAARGGLRCRPAAGRHVNYETVSLKNRETYRYVDDRLYQSKLDRLKVS